MTFLPSFLLIALWGCLSIAAPGSSVFNGTSPAQGQVPFQVDPAVASYKLKDNYTASNFFQSFWFFTANDPTHGFVDYVNEADAWSRKLINTNGGRIYMGVDNTTKNPPGRGRASIRVQSKKRYTHGLFVLDIKHMPGSNCGSWPAYWLVDERGWPTWGEIDIIEGVNLQSRNWATLHTRPGCFVNLAGSQPGTQLMNGDCNFDRAYQGCSAHTDAPFGDLFNRGLGGVYATQWESSGIYIWFFPRNKIPVDISSGKPDTTKWGLPLVAFNGGSGCNIDSYFGNHEIVFDTTFCGDFAGNVWGQSSCSRRTPSCVDYVKQNPGAYKTAYWSLNSLKVYQLE